MKIIEIVADQGHQDTVSGIAKQHDATDVWMGAPGEDGRLSIRMLVTEEKIQEILDALMGILSGTRNPRIVVIPIEAMLPRPNDKVEAKEKVRSVVTSREELYDDIEKNARLDRNFLVLVFLSTIVAAIGLIEDNVAVVIGAMVIAPLLGPNLALALGTALGDTVLMWKSLQTNLAGLGLSLGLAVLIAILWPVNVASHELLARTDVGLDSVALALASGAAAVLSITTGLPSVLVGVMVAVALLPPAATLGLMLGSGQVGLAMGAGLLLAVNVVCVNLAAKVVFLVQGVRPRTWLEKQKARQSMTLYIMIWTITLAILVFAIYLRD
jgi:uncharacterized hydrophobic protein (TIGR00341 family)